MVTGALTLAAAAFLLSVLPAPRGRRLERARRVAGVVTCDLCGAERAHADTFAVPAGRVPAEWVGARICRTCPDADRF